MITRNVLLSGDQLSNHSVPHTRGDIIASVPGTHKGSRGVINIGAEILNTHGLLIGATGSGKTNLLRHILPQIITHMTKDDVMLVFDSKLDFKCCHRAEDLIISNCGPAHDWNIFMDVAADGWDMEAIEGNASEISEVIFADSIGNSSQPFFPMAARDIFSAVVQAMCRTGANDKQYRVKYLNNQVLKKYITMLDAKKLYDFLNEFQDLTGVLKYIGNGKSDQALGVFAELQSVVNRVFSGTFNKNGRLSVRKTVIERQGRVLFVEYDSAHGNALRAAYQVIVDLFLKEALSTKDCVKGKVYVICDELKMLPYLNHFEDALNFGRSLGIAVIAGVQSMQQLYETYGEFGGKNIAAGFQTIFCFCTHDQATRQYIQGLYGKNLSVIQYSTPSGKIIEEKIAGNCIEDWDIASLKRGEAIVGLPFENPFRFYIDKCGR